MTFKYNNVYLHDTATITGPMEGKGPLSKYFDKSEQDYYFGAATWEQAEIKLLSESVDMLLGKIKKINTNIDLFIAGDLTNQIVSSSYVAGGLGIPHLGIYSACATSTEGLIIGANMIDAKQIKNAICSTCSHNNVAEKQFRYPVEYGGPKPKPTTFTTTGAASAYLSNDKKGVRIESATIGTVVDSGAKDVFNMGAVMALGAAKTINDHLNDTKRNADYYDLIVTGDLGIYGKDILKEVMATEYGLELHNLDDTACMIFDIEKQPVYAGGSGSACLPLVAYSYIMKQMLAGKITRVLLVATGSLHNTTVVNQKLSVPTIAHAVSLEVIE